MTYILAFQMEPGHKEHRGFITYSSKEAAYNVANKLLKDKTIDQLYVGKMTKVK